MRVTDKRNPALVADPDSIRVEDVPPGATDEEIAEVAGWTEGGPYFGFRVLRYQSLTPGVDHDDVALVLLWKD